MSIELITGVPGSGKTYFAVTKFKKIYDLKNRPIFTNINLKIDFDEYLHPLDVKSLYDFSSKELHLFNDFKKLSSEYKKLLDDKESLDYSLNPIFKDRVDNSIVVFEDSLTEHIYRKNFIANSNNYDDYLKASSLLDVFGSSYIVWDECQNDLSDDDSIWIRFFSYHRHFNIDIILITQNLSLIHRKYKAFFDKFYFGQNASKRFFSKTLRFKVYSDSKEYEKFYIETISVKMENSIFDFYDSGSYQVGKSAFGKFLIVPFLLIPIIYFAFNLLFPAPTPAPKKEELKNTDRYMALQEKKFSNLDFNSTREKKEDELKFKEDNVIIELQCNKTYCFIINSRFNIPIEAVNAFAKGYDGEVLYKKTISKSLGAVYITIPQNRYEDLSKFEIVNKKDTFGGDKFSSADKSNQDFGLNQKSEVKNVPKNVQDTQVNNSVLNNKH